MCHPPTPSDSAPPSPRLVGLDGGTSSLRAYLFAADGGVAERRAQPWGIEHLPARGYAAAFLAIVGDWIARWPGLPVLAAGMVGSRTGWREVPYVACPADAGAVDDTAPAGLWRIARAAGLVDVAGATG